VQLIRHQPKLIGDVHRLPWKAVHFTKYFQLAAYGQEFLAAGKLRVVDDDPRQRFRRCHDDDGRGMAQLPFDRLVNIRDRTANRKCKHDFESSAALVKRRGRRCLRTPDIAARASITSSNAPSDCSTRCSERHRPSVTRKPQPDRPPPLHGVAGIGAEAFEASSSPLQPASTLCRLPVPQDPAHSRRRPLPCRIDVTSLKPAHHA